MAQSDRVGHIDGIEKPEDVWRAQPSWPSFHEPVSADVVQHHADRSPRMVRIEATRDACDAHLVRALADGPQPRGLRYCMNSLSLDLDPAA